VKTEKLNYELPRELVAQEPARLRIASRLLVLNRLSGELIDSYFSRVGDFLSSGDCLVLNDTRVLQARFFGRRSSGGKLEGLFLSENPAGVWEVMLKGAGKVKVGETIYLRDKDKGDFCQAEVLEKLNGRRCRLEIETESDAESTLEKIGFPPLPPYIKRDDGPSVAAIDKMRYQTVYARKVGAVAAPTAGLHFTRELIEQVRDAGVCFAYITLHVGLGNGNAQIINSAKEKGGRIIAVGTTSVRTVETMAVGSGVEAGGGETKLFIKPGYKFKITDAMVTNFHLPKSSLLALVAAFAGLEKILSAYRYAIGERYRFYSYGDAMLIV